MPTPRRVSLTTLGCARNEVDSEELAGRLADAGWELVEDGAPTDVAVVNTCGFVASAKKDSIDTLLAASDAANGAKVVAVGCLVFWRTTSQDDLVVAVQTAFPPGLMSAVEPVLDTAAEQRGSLVGIGALGLLARRRLAADRTPVLRWAGYEVALMATAIGIAAALTQTA